MMSATSTRKFLRDVRLETATAREKFPSSKRMLGAFVEECGELANALLEHGSESDRVWEEAVQVAAMALRLATEGDPAYPAEPVRPSTTRGGP